MTASLRRTIKQYQLVCDPQFKLEIKVTSDVQIFIKGKMIWSLNHWFTQWEWTDWRSIEKQFRNYINIPVKELHNQPLINSSRFHYEESIEHMQLLFDILWACDRRITKHNSLIRGFMVTDHSIQQLLWSRIPKEKIDNK